MVHPDHGACPVCWPLAFGAHQSQVPTAVPCPAHRDHHVARLWECLTFNFGLSASETLDSNRGTRTMDEVIATPVKARPESKSSVFVDPLFHAVALDPQARFVGNRNGHRWCHMWSEDIEALHVMASVLGLKREWFQDRTGFPHYDLTPRKRAFAIRKGAIQKDLREWLRERLFEHTKEGASARPLGIHDEAEVEG